MNTVTDQSPPSTENKATGLPNPRRFSSLMLIVLINAIMTVCIVTGAFIWYGQHKALQVSYFDLAGFNTELRTLAINGEINETEMMDKYDAMEKWLKSFPKNHIVLIEGVVLANGNQLKVRTQGAHSGNK